MSSREVIFALACFAVAKKDKGLRGLAVYGRWLVTNFNSVCSAEVVNILLFRTRHC